MKQILVLVFAFVTAISARAQDVGFVAGIANNSASTDTNLNGVSVDSDLGYRLGINVMMDLADRVNFRTGVMYTYRPISLSGTGTDLDTEERCETCDGLGGFNERTDQPVRWIAALHENDLGAAR